MLSTILAHSWLTGIRATFTVAVVPSASLPLHSDCPTSVQGLDGVQTTHRTFRQSQKIREVAVWSVHFSILPLWQLRRVGHVCAPGMDAFG